MKISFLFFTTFENGFHFYSFLRFRFFFDFIFFHFYKNELFIFEFFHTFLRTLPGSRLAAYRSLTQKCQRIVAKFAKKQKKQVVHVPCYEPAKKNSVSCMIQVVSLFPFWIRCSLFEAHDLNNWSTRSISLLDKFHTKYTRFICFLPITG